MTTRPQGNPFDDLPSTLSELQEHGIGKKAAQAPQVFMYKLMGEQVTLGWIVTLLANHPDAHNWPTIDLDPVEWASHNIRAEGSVYIDKDYAASLPDHKIERKPLPIILPYKGLHILIDGNHRMFAAFTRGRRGVKATLVPEQFALEATIPTEFIPYIATEGNDVELGATPEAFQEWLAKLPDYAWPDGKNPIRTL